MARAGYCDQCGGNVWLNPDGSCANGHTPEHVSGIYEVPDQPMASAVAPEPAPAGPTPAPAPQSNTKIFVALAIAALLLFGCFIVGILAAIAIPTFESAKTDAAKRACFANQRVWEGSAQVYKADKGTNPDSLSELVPAYLPEPPTCNEGGVYEYEPNTPDGLPVVSCSVHGHYADESLPTQ